MAAKKGTNPFTKTSSKKTTKGKTTKAGKPCPTCGKC